MEPYSKKNTVDSFYAHYYSHSIELSTTLYMQLMNRHILTSESVTQKWKMAQKLLLT
jgi:hypothetical protein